MVILNFSHPLTKKQLEQIADFEGEAIDFVIDAKAQFEQDKPLEPQICKLINKVGWSRDEWDFSDFIINLPPSPVAAFVMVRQLMEIGRYCRFIRMVSKDDELVVTEVY